MPVDPRKIPPGSLIRVGGKTWVFLGPASLGGMWEVRAATFVPITIARHEGWFAPLFWFVWLLRGHEDMRQYLDNPANPWKIVEKWLTNSTKMCRESGKAPPFRFNSDPWEAWFGVSRAEAKAEFLTVWKKSRFKPGHGPLQQAGHLQVISGDSDIMLPCQKVGELLKVSKMTISRYRRFAIEDGYMAEMKPHSFRSKGSSDATQFRFNVSV